MSSTAVGFNIPCSEYRPKILLAQSNNTDLQKIACQADVLNKFDYILAETGEEVLTKISTQCFDAAVLGLKFPDITGSTIAYLIHEFDPLISIIFLTSYDSNILKSVADSIGCKIIGKVEAMKNLPNLMEFIYSTSLELPCDNEKRIINREFVKEQRERFLKYQKLIVPKSIAEIISLKQEA